MNADTPVLEMRAVSKRYQALRPLRVAGLRIDAGERVSVGGLDAGASELLVNLVTGASVPDSGEIRVFGRLTAEITNGDDWLASLDRFGIVSHRAVLLEGATLQQNLAMPFTLSIDPVPEEVAARVRDVAATCGIDPERWLSAVAGSLPVDMRVRAHIARAVAHAPQLLVVEHPTADVQPDARAALASDLARACSEARAAALILTNDDAFAQEAAPRNLTLDGATGVLRPLRRRWFFG